MLLAFIALDCFCFLRKTAEVCFCCTNMDHFELVSPFKPTGDQPEAIKALSEGVLRGDRMQTLKGVTGSGKTFTMANVIAALNKPTLIIAHNKTLAAQLYGEFKEFFPENAVEYFVSYYVFWFFGRIASP